MKTKEEEGADRFTRVVKEFGERHGGGEKQKMKHGS